MLAKPTKPKVTKLQLKKRCDILASRYYRALTPYCELAGLDTITCSNGLQWMHLYSRAILHMRYEPYNNLVGCASHHLFYTYHPIEWTRFLEHHFPERLQLAEANRYKVAKVDYAEWIARFSQVTAQ